MLRKASFLQDQCREFLCVGLFSCSWEVDKDFLNRRRSLGQNFRAHYKKVVKMCQIVHLKNLEKEEKTCLNINQQWLMWKNMA